MRFFAVIFALILGFIIGVIAGFSLLLWTFFTTTDEEFEKKINDLKSSRDKYIQKHKE